MKIENLKDLKALIKLCRLTGVEAIEIDGIKMNLGTEPTVIYKGASGSATKAPDFMSPTVAHTPGEADKIVTTELTDEQMLFWSAVPNEATSDQ